MTSEEIKTSVERLNHDTERNRWLKEIAYQLAVANELKVKELETRSTDYDQGYF